jgi:hypothetical protein
VSVCSLYHKKTMDQSIENIEKSINFKEELNILKSADERSEPEEKRGNQPT